MRRVRRIGGALFLIAVLAGSAERARTEETFGTKIKKIFAPTPTPAPKKHRKTSSSPAPKKKEDAEKSQTPRPSATPEKSPSPSPSKKKKISASPTPAEDAEPSASASPKKKKKSSPTPEPNSSPSASPKKKKKSSPTPEPDASSSASPKKKKHKSSPSPTPEESQEPSSSPSATPEADETPSVTPSPSPKKKGAPATIAAKEISGYENYPPLVRQIVDTALELTTRNLEYKYGSSDPASGGMDCSGFVVYVLTQNGIRDVPRDSSQQYVWVRKAGNFKAVNSRHEDTFELDELVPGDLLFWTGTYSIERDPPITHAMIYLGREKGTSHRIMVGASDGRTYKGESRYGVSVFDFKIPRPDKTDEGRVSPSFIGYGHVPGL
jgi:cell wall-associated NlpC family hydrolase